MAALIAFALAAPGIATGEFLPGAYLLSVSPERAEQTDARTVQVDISQDGSYVAFSTQARNLFPADQQIHRTSSARAGSSGGTWSPGHSSWSPWGTCGRARVEA